MSSLKLSLDKVLGSDLYHGNDTCTCTQVNVDELELIDQGLIYDKANEFWVVKYSWIKDLIKLPTY